MHHNRRLHCLLAGLATAAAAQIGSTINYQLHSYDDIREWPQILRKGVTNLKIDPQYAPAQFCASQPRANHTDVRGCILLNHDSIVTSNWYFSIDDVLSFISDPTNIAFFQQKTTFYIALCFKGNGGLFGPCDGSAGAKNWLSLVDDFFQGANEMITTHKLNVEFVLDGAADPHGGACVAQRWRPWVTTYISGSDPAAAFTSNNATLAYDRYQVLNEDVFHWESAVNASYGKFINSTYAYQCWEPSDQPTVLAFSDAYIAKNLTHSPGFHFATNTDIPQFETYVGSRTGRAWNHLLSAETDSVRPVSTFATSSLYSHALMSVTFFYSNTNAGYQFMTHGYSSPRSEPQLVNSGAIHLPASGDVLAATSAVLPNGTVWVAVAQNSSSTGITVSKWILTTTGQLVLVGAETRPTGVTASAISIATCVGAASDLDQLCISVLAATAEGTPSCRLSIVTMVPGQSLPQVDCAMQDSVLLPSGAALASVLDSAADTVLHAFTYTANATIFGGFACTDLRSGVTVVNDPSACGLHASPLQGSLAPMPTHIGDQPSVSLFLDPQSNSFAVLEVHGHGYCPNNEPQNKNAYTKLCDQKPVYTGGAYLNYNYGLFSDWVDQLLAGNTSSPCSATMYHGMFDMGYNPHATLFQYDNTLNLAVVLEGAGTGASDPNDCGVAAPAVGIKLDGWQPFPLLPAA